MRYSILVTSLLLLFSCKHHSNNSADIYCHSESATLDSVYVDNVASPWYIVDSVSVTYQAIDAYDYVFQYSKGEMHITRTSTYRPFEKHVTNNKIIDNFLNYIDIFFINKSEIIEIGRTRRDPIVTDYSKLIIELFLVDKTTQQTTIQYGEEQYYIEYNPKFVEFYNFLDNLVPTPKGLTKTD